MKSKEINELLELDDNELLIKLGTELGKNRRDGLSLGDKQKLREATIWLKNKLPDLKSIICNDSIKKLYSKCKENDEVVLLISTMADAITQLCMGINPVVVSVLLFRIGIKKLCFEEREVRDDN